MKKYLMLTTRAKAFLLSLLLSNIIGIQAQTFKVNVTIDGPGVVDEYYTPSADGKKLVKLKAVPSKFLGNVTFDGWSGDASGTSEELTVDADKAQNIHATFTWHRPVKQYPKLNLKQSWADMGKPLYYEAPTVWETQDITLWRGTNYLPVDYNRDGYLDIVQFPKKGGMGVDGHYENVRFWLGKPDGSFDEDPKNDNRMQGTVYSVTMKYADFNNDDYPDFCSFSTGYDRAGTTYDYPVILMSNADGVYHDLRYPNYQFGFHSGTTGDFDNDGDIDVIFWNGNSSTATGSLYLENDGTDGFVEHDGSELIDMELLVADRAYPGMMEVEFTDLNNDNYKDFIMCGHDHLFDGGLEPVYPSTPVVFWGDGSGKYGGSNYTLLPPPRLGYGITTSFCFYDFNGDGINEIIVEKNGDGIWGGTSFYESGYLQVCELEGDHYVDKTSHYIPVEHAGFNTLKSECRTSIENIDGTDYYIACGIGTTSIMPAIGTGTYKVYAFRNGIMEPVYSTATKELSYDEGLPIYVDGPDMTDYYFYGDGDNPVDKMEEHHWVDHSTWDATGGNMWRINLHHRKNTHCGRTCIRWNRDGQDPYKEGEGQGIEFRFFSDIDIQKLADKGYYLELFIKNGDPDLTLNISLETFDDADMSIRYGLGAVLSSKNTEEGKFNGEWQRVFMPLSSFGGNGSFSKIKNIWISVDKGDLQNEFFLDDIRIRRLYESDVDDYDRAFMKGYLDDNYMTKERTAQISSSEFKAMLKPIVKKYAPNSMDYFNDHISNYDAPICRGTAAMMAYYVARCIDALESNSTYDHMSGDNFWEGACGPETDLVIPYANTPMAGSEEGWEEYIFALLWNAGHVSPSSNKEVIGYLGEAEGFGWAKAFTWEDAIRAITRLYASLDSGRKVVGDVNGDGVVNISDIVELVNGGGEVNPEEVKAIVNIIMTK